MDIQRPSQVIEEYLLELYELSRNNEKAKAVTLALRLKTSAPTVHATIGRMQKNGLLSISSSKTLKLTKKGFSLAESIAYRHNLTEVFLCDILLKLIHNDEIKSKFR